MKVDESGFRPHPVLGDAPGVGIMKRQKAGYTYSMLKKPTYSMLCTNDGSDPFQAECGRREARRDVKILEFEKNLKRK